MHCLFLSSLTFMNNELLECISTERMFVLDQRSARGLASWSDFAWGNFIWNLIHAVDLQRCLCISWQTNVLQWSMSHSIFNWYINIFLSSSCSCSWKIISSVIHSTWKCIFIACHIFYIKSFFNQSLQNMTQLFNWL